MMKSKKKAHKYTSAKKRAEEHQSGFDRTTINIPASANIFALKAKGRKRIDIIPFKAGTGNPYAEEGDLHYERTFWVHRGIGANQDSYVCLRKTADKKCPICDHIATLRRDPDADGDVIKELQPKERQLWNVIDLDDKDKGVQIWDVSFHLFGKLLDEYIKNAEEDDGYERFFHLEDGFTLKLGVSEKNFAGTNFYEVSTIEFKPRPKPYSDAILDDAHCLDEVVKEVPYKELKDIFLQVGDDDEEEEKETPKAKAKTTKNGDEDQDEEEESPKKSKSKTAKDEDDEPDEDDDWEDDNEDEEPPAKSKAKKKPDPAKDEGDDEDDLDEDTAEDMGIEEGSIVKHKKWGKCEVVHVSGDGTSLRLEDEDGEVHKAVIPGECVVVLSKLLEPSPTEKAKAKNKGKGKGKDEEE